VRPRSAGTEGADDRDDEAWETNEAAEDWAEAAAVDIHAADGEPVKAASWYTTGDRRWASV
jgi:hypothetical protein